MGQINPSLPIVGQPDSTEEPKIISALQAILGVINGSIDAANVADGSITTTEIADGTIAYGDVSADAQNHWLKLLTAADHKLAFGTLTCSYINSTLLRASMAHGLPGTPTIYFAQVISGLQGGAYVQNIDADGTNITVDIAPGYGQPSGFVSGNTTGVCWLAIA